MTEWRRHSSRSSMFERCTSTIGILEDLERVVDRIAVVRPRARVDDQPVRRGRSASWIHSMYSPSLFVCRQRTLSSSSLRPLVDLRLELVDQRPP